ncbi:glutathione hydrolase 1 proenzyme-like [Dendronephthya gigantea]|uniref:glutathione hydrolase 1 proenzyme-like n=1 Tax=Dendronephthya gigantea TaxID=151771 RepID=UPI00106B4FF8|nr:glutathione hydrolase 1 proenzyme-like [Dendronephthya gigantea]
MASDAIGNDEDLYDKAKTTQEDDCHAGSQLLERGGNESLSDPDKKCVQPGGLRVIIAGSIIFALAVTVALIVDIYTGDHNVGHGVVSSDSAQCSMIGESILKKGGSAVDAAIATTLCVGVVCPESSGIGGGGFMLVQSPEGVVKVIDFREVAPAASTKDMFGKDKKTSLSGGLAVAVPGQVLGLEKAHEMFGKLKWKELFNPAIALARNGFKIHNTTEKWLKDEIISDDLEEIVKRFFRFTTNITKRPKLADTLQVIADQGSSGFYSGAVAESIVNTVIKNKGILTLDDLKSYTVETRQPLSSNYQDYRLFTAGPPASGAVLLSALNILEGFNLTAANSNDTIVYHYIVETLKFVYAQRSHLADPGFVKMRNITDVMLSKEEANMLRDRINISKTETDPSYYGPFFDSPPNKGTSHVAVIDRKGGIVTVTSTINGPFGSKLYTPTGIVLNNEMDDFSRPHVSNFYGVSPSKANYIEPGKRPLSSITPVIALYKPDLCGRQVVLGASGGSRITSAIIQVLLNKLTFDRSLKEAIEWPRLHHQLLPMLVEVEGRRFSDEVPTKNIAQFLIDKGNNVTSSPKFIAIVNGASKLDGHLYGHADSRKIGSSAVVY